MVLMYLAKFRQSFVNSEVLVLQLLRVGERAFAPAVCIAPIEYLAYYASSRLRHRHGICR